MPGMRRAALLSTLALLTAACGAGLYESPGYSAADTGSEVALWRLAAGPGGFVGIGGPLEPGALEDRDVALEMAPYHSADGRTWDPGAPFGTVATAGFGLTAWDGGYAAAGVWDGDPAVEYSADGRTWERIALPWDGGAAPELHSAGIAAAGGTILVCGHDAAAGRPVLWLAGIDGTAVAVAPFPDGLRTAQAAAGPAGFVVAATDEGAAGAPALLWVSADGRSWEPVADPFDGRTALTGLVASSSGYVAVLADPSDDAAFTLWTSTDGTAWVLRADQDTVFGHLRGTGGDLAADLTAPAGDAGDRRPVAFSFNGRWLELTEVVDGRRFVGVAAAATASARVASGFTGTDDPQPVVLVAGG